MLVIAEWMEPAQTQSQLQTHPFLPYGTLRAVGVPGLVPIFGFAMVTVVYHSPFHEATCKWEQCELASRRQADCEEKDEVKVQVLARCGEAGLPDRLLGRKT